MEGDDFVVAIVGRWFMLGDGVWDFKLDKSRIGRCISLKGINSLLQIQILLKRLYAMESENFFVGCTYWAEDLLTRMNGMSVDPSVITSDAQLRTFISLSRGDKSINLCVTFREMFGSELRVVLPLQFNFTELLSVVDQPPSGKVIELPAANSNLYLPVVIGSSGSINDDELLSHIEAAEAKMCAGSSSHSADLDHEEDADDLDWGEGCVSEGESSDCFTLESEREEEDYNLDSWTDFVREDGADNVVNAGSDDVVNAGSDDVVNAGSDDVVNAGSDDDFVEEPPVKKRAKAIGIRVGHSPLKMAGLAERFKKGISIHDVYGFDDIEPMCDDAEFSSKKVNDIDFSKEDDAMFVGREFMSREDFKIALSIYAINRVFRFKFVRFQKLYLVAQCVDQNCDWRVYAHQIGDSDEYSVRKAKLVHTCDVNTRSQFTKHATAKVVAALLRSKYVKAASGPRARDVPDIMLEENGVRISYWKGWKAKELALESAHGTEESSFRLLPVYLHVLQLANPWTIYHLQTEKDVLGDDRFKYVFIALGASIAGMKQLRRVVVVDGTHLHGKYKGCLLTASGQDSNFQIFPLAFAVVDSENDASWTWFMKNLDEFCCDGEDLTIVSDRQQSIYKAIGIVFPKARHGACLVHLRRNVKANYKKGKTSKLVWKAGCMFRQKDFAKIYDRIKSRDINCWKFLETIPPEHWTRSSFKGERYNLMTSNIAESLNKALLPARGSPVVALLEFIRRMISRWLASRRLKISKLSVGDLPIAVEKLCLKKFKDSVGFSVMAAGIWDYEVGDNNGERYHVDLQSRSCSCLEFQKLLIPCSHAMAASHLRGLDYKTLVGSHHHLQTWSDTVSSLILPVKDPSEVAIPEEIRILCLMRPKTKRQPGRPPKLRIPSVGEYKVKGKIQEPNKCGRCRGHGHNRVTCTAPLN